MAGEHLRDKRPKIFSDAKLREHLHHGMFNGFHFGNTLLRIGGMNLVPHGVDNSIEHG